MIEIVKKKKEKAKMTYTQYNRIFFAKQFRWHKPKCIVYDQYFLDNEFVKSLKFQIRNFQNIHSILNEQREI